MSVFSLLRIAARNLRRNRRRSLITLLAMFLALTTMIAIKGELNGLNLVVRDLLVEERMGALVVHREGFRRAIVAAPLDLDLPADERFLAPLRATPHVRAVAPRIQWGGLVNAHDHSVFAALLGVDPRQESRVCRKRFADLTAGRPVAPESPTGSDLTASLLSRLGARQGERLALLASDRDGVLNAVEVEVAGALRNPGVFAAAKKLAFVPLATAQELLRMPGRATELAVSVDDLARVDEVAAALRRTLGPGFEVSTWRDFAGFDQEASRMREVSGNWITSIFLFVALLGIANTMLMSVRERTREIGTMMALGMRRRHLLALFLSEAAIIGLLGGLLGLLVGGGLVHHFGEVGIKMPAEAGKSTFELHPYVTASYMIGILVTATLGAVAAALYPAVRASRLRPIAALSQVAT